MLNETQFEYGGVTYTVHAPTIFDEEMFTALWIDWSRARATELGIENLNDLPVTQDRLLKRFVQWMQVTTVSAGNTRTFRNIQDPTGASDAYVTEVGVGDINIFHVDIAHYHRWEQIVLADNQALARLWSAAYHAVTDQQADEKKASGESVNGNTSEPLPSAASAAPA